MKVGATFVILRYRTARTGQLREYRYWRARIMIAGRVKELGSYPTKRDAMRAYQKARASQHTFKVTQAAATRRQRRVVRNEEEAASQAAKGRPKRKQPK